MLKGYAAQGKQEAHVSPMKARPQLNEDLAALDSYDLEGSLEDVNKIIQKYELMLGGSSSGKSADSATK